MDVCDSEIRTSCGFSHPFFITLSHIVIRSSVPPDPLQLDVYQLGFNAKTGEQAKKLFLESLASLHGNRA
jgi:hypothetical protein